MSVGKHERIVLSVASGGLFAVGLLVLLSGMPHVARADPGTLFVTCTGTGTACTQAEPCGLHTALSEAADGDIIYLAQGTYTGSGDAVVSIGNSITLYGGWNGAPSGPVVRDPDACSTKLDGESRRRVVYITRDTSPWLEGLHITGGNATELGGDPWGHDAGGGVYVYEAAATISDCVVYSNTASTASSGSGGGLYLSGSDAALSGNTVLSNTASTVSYGNGGGLFLWCSDATLTSNTVQDNTASTAGWGYGGGLYLLRSDATLSSNTVLSNTGGTAERGYGGGLYVWYSDATLSNNVVQGNTAGTGEQSYGGGLYLSNSDATLSSNMVQGNTASTAGRGYGGGVCLWQSAATLRGNTIVSNAATLSLVAPGVGGGLAVQWSGPFTLTNNLVADNRANTEGSGLWFDGADTDPISGCLLHTTIADNRSSGQGVFVGDYTTLAFTNTIIAGHHSAGITVIADSTAMLEGTLWGTGAWANGIDWGGAGVIITGTVNIWGDPAFVDPEGGDYHISVGSAAIDAGVDAGVMTDIDGEPRPVAAGYDIGADEYVTPVRLYLPVVPKGSSP